MYVLLDLRAFARAVNLTLQTTSKLDAEVFHDIMASVLYRLLNSDFGMPTSHDNSSRERGHVVAWNRVLRLGLLTFSAGVFFQAERQLIQYQCLQTQFFQALSELAGQEGFGGLPDTARRERSSLMLWLVVVCVASYDTYQDQQGSIYQTAKAVIKDLGLADWKEARSSLADILWIDMLYDVPSKLLLEHLLAS